MAEQGSIPRQRSNQQGSIPHQRGSQRGSKRGILPLFDLIFSFKML